ncbi:MAG: GxxExxY protein [Gammaproteobacteria bacterium]
MRELDDITAAIVDASVRIHRDLGPGLLESVYEAVLARALVKRGFAVERQLPIRFEYDGLVFEEGFRTDIMVNNQVVVELKSVERLAPVHSKQLLTYLKLTNKSVGLLINFGAATLKEGLHRIVNGLPPSLSPRLRVNQPVSGSSGSPALPTATHSKSRPLDRE